MGCCSSQKPVPINPNTVDLSHFELLKVVGKGGFGKVNAVENKIDHKLYAMKTLKKGMLLSSEAYLRSMWIERSVMARFKSPFLVHLHWAFHDDQYLYLIMDFMRGGDLRYYLEKRGAMTEETCRFYAAEILLAMEEMHSLGLIYRDLKPENILLEEDGHLCVSDFGLVYDLTETKDGMTSGEAGTRGYLAPEVLAPNGRYNWSQDVWSYGITLYELLHLTRPFHASHEVLNMPLRFAPREHELTPECQNLLKSLLDKNVETRLGCNPKTRWEAVKKHPWFKCIDWDVARNRGLKPPFLPDVDVANCSPVFDLEDQFFGDEKTEKFTPEQQARFKGFEFNVDKPAGGLAPTTAPNTNTSTNMNTTTSKPGATASGNATASTNTPAAAGTTEKGSATGAGKLPKAPSSPDTNGVRTLSPDAVKVMTQTTPESGVVSDPRSPLVEVLSTGGEKDHAPPAKSSPHSNTATLEPLQPMDTPTSDSSVSHAVSAPVSTTGVTAR